MDRSEVYAHLVDLARPETQVDDAERIMARLDDHALDAVPWVYRWMHEAVSELDVHAATRVLGRWLDLPLARALAPALRVMLREPAVADLSKLAAAALLERMGQPVDDEELRVCLQDVTGLAGRALQAALAAAETAAAAVHVVEAIGEMPPDARLALVDDLVRLGDPRAAIVLGPLSNDRDGRVAVAAVAGIDLLSLAPCTPHVGLAAEHHPDEGVREQAAVTRSRLARETRHARRTPARVLLGSSDGSDARMAVIVVGRSPSGKATAWDVLTIVTAPGTGVREYAVAERLDVGDLDALLERFADGGVELRDVDPSEAEAELHRASATSLAEGRGSRLGYLVWPLLLEGTFGSL